MREVNFKHTEIGPIPHDWEVKTLGEILTICNGRDYKHLPYGNVPVYGTGGVIAMVNDYLYDGETICIGRKGTIDKPQYHKGKIWTVDTLFYTKDFGVNPLFLYYKCNTINWLAINEATGVPSLTSKNIAKVNVTLPPTFAEQERIAGALSSIDTLIGALNEQIEKKRHIKQGTMQQLLTGKKRLAGFTGEWKICKIKDIVGSVKRGQGLQSKDYAKGNIPVVAGGKQYAGFHNVANHFGCTITVSGSGANAGYVAFHAIPIFATDCSVIDDNDDFVLAFVYYVLLNKQSEIYKLQSGGAQPHIYPKNIEDIIVSIPPTIAEQSAIAAVLSGMDTEIAALEQKRDKYIVIKSGMMQDLLTGKIRLV